MPVRFFVSQEALDTLVAAGAASVGIDSLEVPVRRLSARIAPAVYVSREIEGKGDPHGIVGKVKTIDAIAAMRADHYRDSLLVGDTAYEVVEGFLGEAQEGWSWPDGGEPAASFRPSVPPSSAAARRPSLPPDLPGRYSVQDAGETDVCDVMERMILDTVKDGKKKGNRRP